MKWILRFSIYCCSVWLLAENSVFATQEFMSAFPKEIERNWIGPDYWSNRLQDWRIADGRLECLRGEKNKPMRTVHLLTRRMSEREGDLFMSVRCGVLDGKVSEDSAAGFLIGAGGGLDYRAAALVHHSWGPDGGLFAGIDGEGNLFVRDFRQNNKIVTQLDRRNGRVEVTRLTLSLKPVGKKYVLTLQSLHPESEEVLGSVTIDIYDPELLIGNMALVSHPGAGGRYWFQDWKVSGRKADVDEERHCGPILCTQYTLSEGILKMTAQMMPIGRDDNHVVLLQIKDGQGWKTVDTTKIIAPGYTAPFRVTDWDSSQDVPYRVVYELKQADGLAKPYFRHGTIRHDPVEKTTISIAGFTGNHNMLKGAENAPFPWNMNGVWFPHTDIIKHVWKQDPDILFFSGDQVYEGASPTQEDQQHAELDYLYKWYLWCWAFRDLTKDIPAITEPDDHDVFQGNIWGAGGRKTPKDDHGGYEMPAEWVNMVERTQTSHLPDPYDPTPIEQGITVYYTDMNYGRISIAIIEDRKFKSGCAGLIPGKQGRADHILDPEFDVKTLDKPGLKLLGDRQLTFLKDWAVDWENTDMKVVVSQTVFANVATHHGPKLEYLHADLDSNGWPQSGRKRALDVFRRCFAFMLGGDQHLATIVHHGIDTWNDAGWSMCVPSVANFYPRAWWPKQEPRNHIEGMPNYTGEFLDGLGNYVTMWAATNPDKLMGVEPAALHDRMPGYGIVRLNKETRDIIIECWPRFADPEDPDAKQYLGWPKTINQLDNYSREAVAWLPAVEVDGMDDPVVQVINESNDEIVYTLRINGTSFRPKVFREGKYTVKVGELGTKRVKVFENIESIQKSESKTILVNFGISIAPPKTKKKIVTETLHGVEISDPYRWLEDQDRPETREWIDAQIAYTQSMLQEFPEREAIRDELAQFMKIDKMSGASEYNGRFFFMKQRSDQEQWVIYMREGMDGEDQVLIDPNLMSEDHTTSVSMRGISKDGTLLAYGIKEGGEDEAEIRFMDVDTKTDLKDFLPKARIGSISILNDKSGFYYSLHQSDEGSRIYYHTMGTDAGEDKMIFGEGFGPQEYVSCGLSDDNRYLYFTVSHGWSANDLYVQDRQSDGPIVPIVKNIEANFSPIQFIGNTLYLHTNWNAPNYKVVEVHLDHPAPEQWKEIIPERDYVLESVSAAGGNFFGKYLKNVVSFIQIFSISGKEMGDISFPAIGSVGNVWGRFDSEHAFFNYSSFHIPNTVYHYNVKTGKRTVWFKPDIPIDTDNFEVKQIWYHSKDGTEIPMFLVHQKGIELDESHPTLLYGYGGFNINITPGFSNTAAQWVKHGGVYAEAILRGGGEFGEEWHQAGMLEKKQNVFDDFIAASEWLIENGYTNPSKLGIFGGSNGGLLVGAALTQRPELYQAVLCAVPLLDMVRYHKFLLGKLWIPEYGSADDPEQFKYLHAYSPYHRVKEGTEYPSVMFVTGDSDTRVAPLHARKMTALLQSVSASERPILLRYEKASGHSAGIPLSMQIEKATDQMVYLFWQLGLSVD